MYKEITQINMYRHVADFHFQHYEAQHLLIYHLNPLNTKRRQLYLKTQFVPRSKYFSSRL